MEHNLASNTYAVPCSDLLLRSSHTVVNERRLKGIVIRRKRYRCNEGAHSWGAQSSPTQHRIAEASLSLSH